MEDEAWEMKTWRRSEVGGPLWLLLRQPTNGFVTVPDATTSR